MTIASGFDLGAHSAADLAKLSLGASMTDKLDDYLGLKGQAAVDRLTARPLTISSEEADLINATLHSHKLAPLVVAYDAVTGWGSFYNLPREAMTVLASVSFQYGDLAKATPNFWSQMTKMDWNGALANLRNFGDAYTTRRNLEADLLEQALSSGTLHQGMRC